MLSKINIFKKIRFNNFVSGLIFGAIFSLIVNIITIQIQDLVQKQRVLEALEYEIFDNASQAEATIKENTKIANKEEKVDYYHNFLKYSNKVWNSNEFLKYGLSIDPQVQTQIHTYYTVSVNFNNEILNKNDKLMENQLNSCYLNNGTLKRPSEKQCTQAFNYFFILEAQSAKRVFDKSLETLKVFHPTKDRMENPILRFLMGDKSIGALSKGAFHP